jgi:HlyD family secretion protein
MMQFFQSAKQKFSAVKRWKKIAFVLVLIIVGFFFYSKTRPQKSTVTFDAVTRQDVENIISESGNAQAAGQFEVYSPSTGYIENTYVHNGDTVKVGQKLFRVKSTATAQEKAAASASYLQAKTAYDSAQATAYTLRSSMFSKWRKFMDLATNATYQNADLTPNTANRDAAEFQVASDDWNAAQANDKNQLTAIAQAQSALTNTSFTYQATQDITVTAPAAGQVANFAFAVNDKVTASSASAPVPVPILVIGDFSKVIVKIPLNEVDVNNIKPGQSASLTFDAMRDKPYNGHVDNVNLVGTNTAGVITYTAYIIIDNPDENIKPAMTVTVAIETAKHPNVLTVPNSAIKPYKGSKAVIVEGADKEAQVKDKTGKLLPYHYVPVTVGLKGVSDTEVLSGVSEGTKVVTGGLTL